MINNRLYAIARAWYLDQLTPRERLQELDFWTAIQLFVTNKPKLLALFWKGGVTTCGTPTPSATPIEV